MSASPSEVDRNAVVLLAVPVLNEEAAIAECLRSLLQQDCAQSLRVVVADGGSVDRTREIVRELQKEFANLFLISNPGRLQSAGVNMVARSQHPGDVLIRADAHAIYPRRFVRACFDALKASGAMSVVVPMRTEGRPGFQRAVATAQNSLFGNGGAAHRRPGGGRFVDHGHHAAFRRSFFLELGGYDESFRCNEDAEFDARVGKAGGRIWLCPEAAITYFPRSTVGALARQYRNHGRGRADTLLTHRMKPKARQMAPVGIAGLFVASLLLTLVWPTAAVFWVAIVSTYVAFGAMEAWKAREIGQSRAGLAAAVMHFSWAFGFSTRLVSWTMARAMRGRWPSVLRAAYLRGAQRDAPVGS
jgi:succinoglycan biosynthesis protein ExoA